MSRVIRPRNERSKWNKGKASSYTDRILRSSGRWHVSLPLSLSFSAQKSSPIGDGTAVPSSNRTRNSFEEVWWWPTHRTRFHSASFRVYFSPPSFIGLYEGADLGSLDQLIQSRLNAISTPSIANNYPARARFSEFNPLMRNFYCAN